MDDLSSLFRDLYIVVDNCEHNGNYIRFTFGNYDMFIKYVKYVVNCKMSSELSRNIHMEWTIQILNNNNIIYNVMDLLNNFSDEELNKVVEHENREYYVIFPYTSIRLIIDKLINVRDQQYVKPDECFAMCDMYICDTNDDLIYSDDEL
jgi:hypothetical protein